MTDEEMKQNLEHIAKVFEESDKRKASRSPEEEKRLDEMAEQTRLWEDWTDCDPVTNAKSRSSEKQSDH